MKLFRISNRLLNKLPISLLALLVIGSPFVGVAQGFGNFGESGAMHRLRPAKRALEQRLEQVRQAAVNAPRPAKDSNRVRLYQQAAEPAWPAGIIESGQAPFPGGLYRIENQWQQVVGNQHTNVYAGALGADPAQGVIVVRSIGLDLKTTTKPVAYLTPTRVGPLRIVGATGLSLTLQAANGSKFTFDVVNRNLGAH